MTVLAACSSSPASSGVTSTKLLSTLSASERDQLCSLRTEVENAPRIVSCRDMRTVVIQDKASCVSAFGSSTSRARPR